MIIRLLTIAVFLGAFTVNTRAQEAANPVAEDATSTDETETIVPVQSAAIKPQPRYVSDQFYVPLREAPCSRCKIVHRGLKSGTKLMLIRLQEGWALTKTGNGTEGWVEEQFLSDTPVARMQLIKDQKTLQTLKTRNDKLEEIMRELRQQSNALRGELDSTSGNNDNLAVELANIKEISADAIALNTQNQQLVKKNHLLQGDNDVLKANVDNMKKDRSNQSFLYGGITAFLGAILVALIPKLRGRKRFSEWQ
jgi:SH3 domain protein